ncbi:MAG: FAD-dependent monooxygenase [Acidiferrobacterales bacterium]|nr:FAD-dependent monooxygenase [Acidiferrobacterales bacterium]
MKILVAGAGIGGLSLALCLQKSGHKVQLFEKSKRISDIGAGLQLGANALVVLDYLGLLADIESKSVAPERVDFRSFQSGEILHSANLGVSYKHKYSAPYLHVHRADLQEVLLRALNDQTEIHLDSEVVAITESEQGVNIELQNGSEYSGDCLVAADGIKSTTRTQFISCDQAEFTGNVAWRGVIPVDQLPENFMEKVVINFVGPQKHMVIYYLRQQRMVNFVGVVEDPLWSDQSWNSKAPWRRLKEDFDGWHPIVQTLIDAMQGQDCYRWALYDQKPINNWSSKRVTLLGDAAHATLPFLASGAAMAIEDSRILQRALDSTDVVESALQVYQRTRYARTAKVQQLSRRMSKLYHLGQPSLLKLAFKFLRMKSAQTEAFLGGYDANNVELQL